MCGTTAFEHAQPLLLRLAHRKPADGEPRPSRAATSASSEASRSVRGTCPPCTMPEQAAGRASRPGSNERGCAPPSASSAPSTRAPRFGGRIGRAVVKRHRDVGAQRQLHVHGIFGREAHVGAVDGRAKPHALLRDLAQAAQAEHLETAGVREDRALPVHEAVQPAVRGDDLRARPQHQVKRIAEHDLRAQSLRAPRASSPSRVP